MTRWLWACLRATPIMLVWGCSDARLLDGIIEGQTRIRLSPSEFVGQVPCRRDAEGALRRYVARLYQVDASGQIIGLDGGTSDVQTSPPAPCDRAVVYPAAASRFYAAEVLGFDRDVSEAEASTVAPRWRASCGFGGAEGAGGDPSRFAPTLTLRGNTVPLRGCTQFGEGLPVEGIGQLEVDVAGALGALACGRAAGEVGFVEATLGSLTTRASCGERLVFDIAGPARYHTVSMTGFELLAEAGAPPVAPPADAALPADVEDAGQIGDGGPDASLTDAGETAPSPPSSPQPADAEPPDGGSMELVGVPRWSTRCIGQSVPGLVSVAACEPFTPLP